MSKRDIIEIDDTDDVRPARPLTRTLPGAVGSHGLMALFFAGRRDGGQAPTQVLLKRSSAVLAFRRVARASSCRDTFKAKVVRIHMVNFMTFDDVTVRRLVEWKWRIGCGSSRDTNMTRGSSGVSGPTTQLARWPERHGQIYRDVRTPPGAGWTGGPLKMY